METDWQNKLYFGDNLEILRDHVGDESVDLIYLDPPFNSKVTYNVLFKEENGTASAAQVDVFEDTWHWVGEGPAEEIMSTQAAYQEVVTGGGKIGALLDALHQFLGSNDMMAYLVMMAIRLIELHRVLKPTGSIYLHCDPTASHYLKLLIDAVFGVKRLRNEIVWKRTHSHGDARRRFGKITDRVFLYTKSDTYTFNRQYMPYSEEYIEKYYRHVDEKGRRYQLVTLRSPNPRPNLVYDYKGYKPHRNGWAVSREQMEKLDRQGRLHFPADLNGAIREKYYLDEMRGVLASDVWMDIGQIYAHAKERIGYQTQKP